MSKAGSLSRAASIDATGGGQPESALLKSIMMADPATIELAPEPIPQEWILNGAPAARSKNLARSRDWTSTVVVWDCTAGRFVWHYNQDEAIFVISGEAFLLLENGEERRLGAGHVGFFPAGTTATWRVADYIRKVALVHEAMWPPLGLCLKAWKKLLRLMGLAGKSPF